MLGDSLRRIELAPALIIFSPTNVMTESGNFEGSCGGDFSYTLNFNRVSERFSGNLSFRDYCNDVFTISGKTDIDGSFEVSSVYIYKSPFLFYIHSERSLN